MILLKIKKNYVSKKDGKEKITCNLYLKLDNGDLIAIKPAFDKNSKDYYALVSNAKLLNNLNEDTLPF